jgi:hypothetical protein
MELELKEVKEVKEEIPMPENAGSTLEESFPESNEPAMPDNRSLSAQS